MDKNVESDILKNATDSESLVTVILGVYNQEKFVRKSIESILSQSHRNIEIIISNNGSTDGSASILSEYCEDPRIRIINYAYNMSISATTNRAIELARGEYICCIAGDDYYLPTYIESHLSALSVLPYEYGVVYSPYWVCNDVTGSSFIYNKFNKSGDVFDSLINAQLTGFISAFTPFLRKRIFDNFKYDETMFCEGEAIFIRMAKNHKFKYLNNPLYVATDHCLNQGKNYKENSEQFLAASRRQVYLFPEKTQLINKVIAFMFVRNAWIAIRIMGDKKWAKKCIKIAVAHRFSSLFHFKLIAVFLLFPFNKNLIDIIFYFRKNKGRIATYIEEDYSGRAQ